MRVANGVEMLKISANLLAGPGTIYPVVISDDDTMILVDTGLPGLLPLIVEEMEKARISFERLRKIIVTHQDWDHIGNISAIIKKAPETIDLLAYEAETPYIQGDKPPAKMSSTLKAQLDSLPEEKRKEMAALYSNKVTQILSDGEDLPYCGGITVIHTPGHTPGHISLYLKQGKILISGDALNAVDGKLLGPNLQYSLDMDLALNSLKKLSQYDIEKVICYHGGLCTGNINRRIAELANEK